MAGSDCATSPCWRDLNPYHDLIAASFAEHELPCFIDSRAPPHTTRWCAWSASCPRWPADSGRMTR